MVKSLKMQYSKVFACNKNTAIETLRKFTQIEKMRMLAKFVQILHVWEPSLCYCSPVQCNSRGVS